MNREKKPENFVAPDAPLSIAIYFFGKLYF